MRQTNFLHRQAMHVFAQFLVIALLGVNCAIGAPRNHPGLKTNVVTHPSAAGWSLRVAADESTIVVSPKGRELRIGRTQYPDWSPATLWRVRVPALQREFLILHVSPMASGAVPLTVMTIKADGDSTVRAADILHHYEWQADITTPNQILDALFVDSDRDGVPELVDDDVGKSGGTRTYHVLTGDRFVPKWRETFKLEESTGRIGRASRELVKT